MKDIAAEQKRRLPLWIWFIGPLLVVGVVWFWFGWADRDGVLRTSGRDASGSSTEAGSGTAAGTAMATAAADAAASPAVAMTVAASEASVGDPGFYAATVDKGSLAGREGRLSGATVARIVGPKSFTVVSGDQELIVVIDSALDVGVGSQGRIGVGDAVTLKGTFRPLDEDTIREIADRRFRALTDLERQTLAKTPIYLQATEFFRRE